MAAFYEDKTITKGGLILSDLGGMVTKKETIKRLTVAATLLRGRLMGKITKGAWSVAAAVAAGAGSEGANTGTGTCTKDVTLAYLANVMVGAYLVKVTRAYVAEGTVAGAYEVFAPNGVKLGDGVIGDTWAKHIKFVLAEAGITKFVVGDAFTLTVAQAAGSGYLADWDPAAVDGTEVPYGVLGNDVAVLTSAEATGSFVYLNGKFRLEEVTAKSGVTVANYVDAWRDHDVYLVSATDEI